MRMPQAVKIALVLIERFEGLRLKPYLCPAGIWTIGLGNTYYLDGTPVRPGDPPLTREAAYILAADLLLAEYLPGVLKAVGQPATYKQLGALLSFAWNIGVPRFRTSTCAKKAAQGDWAAAADNMLLYTRASGRVLPGLVRRRAAEAALVREVPEGQP